jgi:hypothetical protein
MRRKLFIVVSLLSLLLCVATVVLWIYLSREATLRIGSLALWLYDGIDGPTEVIVGLPDHPSYYTLHLLHILVVSIVVFSLTAMVSVLRWFRRARLIRSGGCSACGYDLTGNTSGVCPECGTAVAGKA